MDRLVIITGASSGLGKAVADFYLMQSYRVLSISRRIAEEHKNVPNFIFHPCNLGNIDKIDFSEIDQLVKNTEELTLIINAATIEPILRIGSFSKNEIVSSIAVNCTSITILVNYVMSKVRDDQKVCILNVTSGASNKSIEFWSLYSAGKAFMSKFFDILREEFKDQVNILQFDPGVINTSMQNKIRSSEFPDLQNFEKLKKENRLKSPDEVAKQIFELTQ